MRTTILTCWVELEVSGCRLPVEPLILFCQTLVVRPFCQTKLWLFVSSWFFLSHLSDHMTRLHSLFTVSNSQTSLFRVFSNLLQKGVLQWPRYRKVRREVKSVSPFGRCQIAPFGVKRFRIRRLTSKPLSTQLRSIFWKIGVLKSPRN